MTKRLIRVDGDLAYVTLTQGYETVIDATDVPLVDRWKWAAIVSPSTVYVRRGSIAKGVRFSVSMPRMLMAIPDGLEVCHIDGNGLNNRRSNLRLVTRSQNRHNLRISRNNTSGYKGVSWCSRSETWRAQITLSGKILRLGSYPTAELAHAAYVAENVRLHGEFCRSI